MKNIIILGLFFLVEINLAQKRPTGHHHEHQEVKLEDLPINNIAKECTKIGNQQVWKFTNQVLLELNYKPLSIFYIPNFEPIESNKLSTDSIDFIPYHHFDYFKQNNIKKLDGNGTLVFGMDSIPKVNYTTFIDYKVKGYKHSLWYIWEKDSETLFAINEKTYGFPSIEKDELYYYSSFKKNKTETNLFPNPTTNSINFKAIENIKKVMIYDDLGKIIITNIFNSNEVVVNVASLKKGTYKAKVFLANNLIEILAFVKI